MEIVEKSLLEQMQLSDREVSKRMDLFDLTEREVGILRSCKRAVVERLDWAIEQFYDRQLENRDVALIIGDAETLRRLKSAMRGYIVDLFDGSYGPDYVNSRLRVGKIHWRIGVTPQYFLSALRRLYDILCVIMDDAADDPADGLKRKDALLKILFFDSQLVFDTYINALMGEVEAARNETEEYAESLEELVAQRTRELEQLTRTDSLTDVFNKRAFDEHLRRELAAAQRNRHPLALVYVDINEFKRLNDTFGHQAGDDVLVDVAARLASAVRENDIVCRVGGDEFCVIMPGVDKGDAQTAAHRFLELLVQHDDKQIGVSVGVADTGPAIFCSGDDLVRQADQNMYRAKRGRAEGGEVPWQGRVDAGE